MYSILFNFRALLSSVPTGSNYFNKRITSSPRNLYIIGTTQERPHSSLAKLPALTAGSRSIIAWCVKPESRSSLLNVLRLIAIPWYFLRILNIDSYTYHFCVITKGVSKFWNHIDRKKKLELTGTPHRNDKT